MKTWNSAVLVDLNVAETAEGGKDLQKVDAYWTDKNTGDLYASYASGGDTTGNPIEVIK